MLDKAILSRLRQSEDLVQKLTSYDDVLAIFNQSAPPDTDKLWGHGPQYPRIVFSLDTQDDAARAVGGKLLVDVQCQNGKQVPEDFEVIVRERIDGCFFSADGCTMAAQWSESRYFTEPTDAVCGVTLSFTLLAFPMLTTKNPDVIARVNRWTAQTFPDLLVLGESTFPETWRPSDGKSAVYWRVAAVKPAEWIPDTHQTIWRTATLTGHVFAPDISAATVLADEIIHRLDCVKRLLKPSESQIIVNRANSVNAGPTRSTRDRSQSRRRLGASFPGPRPIS